VDIGGVTGARGVGLFSYIYHDYVTAIGAACVQGQGPLGTEPDALLRCRVFANNLTRGLIPGPFMNLVPLDSGKESNKRAASAAFLSYCRPYSRFPEYLLLGRCRPPATIECEQVPTWYWAAKPEKGTKQKTGEPPPGSKTLSLDAVTAGAFEAANGSMAHVIVNATPDPRKATATLPPGPEAVVFSAERKELSRVPAAKTERRVPLELEPFGVRIVVHR
jgi:hypothetical protein